MKAERTRRNRLAAPPGEPNLIVGPNLDAEPKPEKRKDSLRVFGSQKSGPWGLVLGPVPAQQNPYNIYNA
jgi:hypothetical protein